MKLIIDIPDYEYRQIKEVYEKNDIVENTYGYIYHGTPLDDVKAEIKGWYWQADKQALAKDPCVVDAMVDLFIRTIDNIGKESEDT